MSISATIWWRKLAFCAVGSVLVILMVLMLFLAVVPYDIDVVVDAYLDDDLDPKLITTGSRLKEAHEKHTQKLRRADMQPERPANKRRDELDDLMRSILNPEVVDPDQLIPCTADEDTLTEHTGAKTWMEKKQSKVREQWQNFQSVYIETLARTRYCIAQAGENQCGQYRWGSDDDWYIVAKDDLPPLSNDDGMGDITLISQGSFDRVDVFGMIGAAWSGPKVAVFAIYDVDDSDHAEALKQIDEIANAAKGWTNVKVIIYPVKVRSDYYTDRYRKHDPSTRPLLPLNTMRNIAMDHARTNFVFTCDMDFVPSTTLYPKLTNYLLPKMAAIDRGVFVVPHWEALECENSVRIPRDFATLRTYAQQGIVRPFHVTAKRLMPSTKEIKAAPSRCNAPSAVWSFGVQTSNYNKWYRESMSGAQGMFPLKTKGPSEDKYWEPFVIVKRVEPSGARLPRYHEQYVGRYKNKISFITTLRGNHYHFYTLRQEFLTHVPHPTSNQSAPAMHEHLLTMRKLHTEDRQKLYTHAWTQPPEPPLERSPFDNGLHCMGQLPGV
eukprot:TRINITY_DN6775_c0_g1_i1.p1 TRINITY_DN6775_c0_g1~~TRINITY_DN6775_c0_g1_i1.p1  ORF type:complete len:552 (+),score=108.42 TRINITY_DN6775_c0_g1_i1:169-1824(+)